MKRLKLTQRNYVGYTGVVGRYHFVDGVSLELIPENERIRIGANMACVEIEEDGEEGANPSPAHSVVDGRMSRMRVERLQVQSDDEKALENVAVMLDGETVRPLYSEAALEAVADKGGIAALRDLAEIWDVRSKAIPALITLILTAQKSYVSDRTERLRAGGANKDDLDVLFALQDEAEVKTPKVKAPVVKVEKPVVSETFVGGVVAAPTAHFIGEQGSEQLLDAAKTGDLAAALNAE